ncbi:MAG TPA: contractile injection system protein, VgrG/Pvc8 family [Myxococcales bacterium]|nr:contractile injection system protein, VgrG/Pvc8 family [Myxococcales bacterium]
MQSFLPDCRVSVGGKPLPAEQAAALIRVNVDLDVDLFGCCVLHFNDPRLQLINGAHFASGTPVEVELGSMSEKESIFHGDVVALEPQFRRNRPPSLQVVCEEALHRLGLGSMTRAFNDVDDKQIAAQIAREHGLSADAPSGTSTHVLQANLSDAAFLRRIAQKSGNHLRIEGKQIVVGPLPKGRQIELGPESGILKLRVQIESNSQVNEVTVHGWDPARKREIVGKASSQQHGCGTLSALADEPEPADVATAEAMARGRMRKLAEGFITAQMELRGNAKIAPGAEMTLDELGPQVGGTWRVEHAEHRSDRHGYRVKLRAVRIARPKPRGSTT